MGIPFIKLSGVGLSLALMFSCAGPDKKLDKIEGGELPDELLGQFVIKDQKEAPGEEMEEDIAGEAKESSEAEPVEKAQAGAGEKPQKGTQKSTKKEVKKPVKKKKGFAYPSRRPEKDPIWVGENQTLEVTYFGVTAGLVDLKVLPYKQVNDRKVYHIQAHAKSSKVFSLFYRLDDRIESFLDYQGIFSHRFNLVLDESKQTRNSLELYDSRKKKTFYWDRWNHHKKGYREKKEYHDLRPFSQDSLSALYYLRTLKLEPGSRFEYPVVSEGKTWDLDVRVLRREVLDTKPFGRISTIVVQPITKFNGIVKQKGDSFIWLTDDERRFVVRLEAKVKVGTVAAILRSVELGNRP